MTTEEMYEKFGIKKDVIDFGKTVLGEIEDRFAKIDAVESNSCHAEEPCE